jgi:bacterioferritin
MSVDFNSAELGRNLYPFLSEVADMRRRTRQHIQDAAFPDDPAAVQSTVLRLLQEALATELICVSRYRRHSVLADGATDLLRGEFLKYAQEEQGHVEQIAERIVQLGGVPNLTSAAVTYSHDVDDLEADTIADMLAEDLIAERIAIQSYGEIVQYLTANDPITGRMLECILALEVAHADELVNMRASLLRSDRSGATSTRLPLIELKGAA